MHNEPIDLSRERTIRRLVARVITCPVNGERLDARTCAVIANRVGDIVGVISPAAAARIAANPIQTAAFGAHGVTIQTR